MKVRQAADRAIAEDLLGEFEVEMGLKSPDTTPVGEPAVKALGPSTEKDRA